MGSTYGIRGWLKVFSFTELAENIFDYQPWSIKKTDKWHVINLESWKHHKKDFIIKIKGIHDLESAMLLTNCKIIVDTMQLPDLDSDEFYWKDLLGCQVITIDGYQIGEVINLIKTGSNDVLVVKASMKDAFDIQERLIPFLDKQVIRNIDLKARVIEVDWERDFF